MKEKTKTVKEYIDLLKQLMLDSSWTYRIIFEPDVQFEFKNFDAIHLLDDHLIDIMDAELTIGRGVIILEVVQRS